MWCGVEWMMIWTFSSRVGAGVKTNDEKYDLVVWAKNLGNVRALTAQSLSTNVALGGVSYIEPLTIGATLRTKF